MHPSFKFREKYTPELLELLETAVLGTNGAHYRHVDTEEKIEQVDNPLHLTFERNNKPTGNVTFCRRDRDWYVRYFAFSGVFQSSGKKKSKAKQSNFLKNELNEFFESTLEEGNVDSFYAYIDPNNEKSIWMSENFGFDTIGQIATQTFSRVRPKSSNRLIRINDSESIRKLVENNFKAYQYFFDSQTFKAPLYALKDGQGEIIAFTKISKAQWEIKRLPGKLGGFLVKIIPFIPGLNKLIRPKKHSFLVPEAVIAKDNDSTLVDELFQAILHTENEHVMIWWVDEKDNLYKAVKSKIKWGLLHKLIGINHANVVQRRCPNNKQTKTSQPIFTAGIDFI